MFCKVSYQKLLNHLQIFMSKEEYLRELLKWVSSDSLLVLDKLGKLRRVYVPFWVVSLIDFPDITKGQIVPVDAIKLTVEVKEIYIIKGTAYYIIYFKIILE
jgi:hypothetical protein